MEIEELIECLRNEDETDASAMMEYMEEAASALEAQQERIAELESERRWIPMGERLPEDYDPVMVCVTAQYQNIRLEQAILLAQYVEGDGWVLEMFPEIESPDVTHWMPLPEMPKEDG